MDDQDRLEGIGTDPEGPTGSGPGGVEESDDGSTSEDAESGGLAGEIEELRRALDSLNDRHLRLAAEFDNYRKRSQAQLGEARVRAQASLVASLLDVLDDFGRVTSTDPESATVESVLEGVALVQRKLFQLLQDAGLEEIDPTGEPFDPNVMEAMVRMPAASEEEDDTVEQVFQRGFRFGGHLVRPARVSVRKFE
jgi:molecular chaperone GrpE